MIGGEIRRRQHQHARRQPEQLAVARDQAGTLEREQNAPRGRARQVGGFGEIAQRHRLLAAAKQLEHPQAAVEAFDEIRRAAVVRLTLAFQFRHGAPPPIRFAR